MNSDENSVVVKRKIIKYEHDVVKFVPVFQKDFDKNGELLFSPTFICDYSLITQDEQMAWSFEPDYVLELKGHFNATTKPLVLKDEK